MTSSGDAGPRVNQAHFTVSQKNKVLANAEVFNRQNDAERRTFDEIFHKRMFNSYIYKESNVYDRTIAEYKTTGMGQLLESDKGIGDRGIKGFIAETAKTGCEKIFIRKMGAEI